jgi:hypothetical protein
VIFWLIVRGKIWCLAVGNDLKVTEKIFADCISAAKELLESRNDITVNASAESIESSVESVSRTVTATTKQLKENTIDVSFPSMSLVSIMLFPAYQIRRQSNVPIPPTLSRR